MTTIPETTVLDYEDEPAPDETTQPTNTTEPQEYISETTLLEETDSSPTTLPETVIEIPADEPVTDEQLEQILDTLTEAAPEQIVAAITQVLAADITSDQATEIASSPEVLAAITETQAEQLFEQIVVEELTEKQEHCDAVAKWLTSIDLGITPEGVHWSYETISTRYQKPTGTTVELPPTASELVEQLKHVKMELKAYTEMEDRLKAELCEMIGSNEYATVNGTVIATWKGRTWSSLDIKAIKAMEPAITEKYSKKVTNRTLLLKGERA